jgi:hypothetical protein
MNYKNMILNIFLLFLFTIIKVNFLLASTDTNKISFESISAFTAWHGINLSDVNHIIREFGFFDDYDNGVFLYGLDLRVSTHGDFFIGFIGAHSITHSNSTMRFEGNEYNTLRRYEYSLSTIGARFGRSFQSHERIFISPSIVVGLGRHKINIGTANVLTGSNWCDLNTYFDNSVYDSITFQNNFFILQPSIDTSLKISGRIYIDLGICYIFGIPHSNWKMKNMIHTHEIPNSTNTYFNGFTINLGPRVNFK